MVFELRLNKRQLYCLRFLRHGGEALLAFVQLPVGRFDQTQLLRGIKRPLGLLARSFTPFVVEFGYGHQNAEHVALNASSVNPRGVSHIPR